MGDRCWAKLTIKKTDIPKFIAASEDLDDESFYIDPDPVGCDNCATCELEDINYGGMDMVSELTKNKLTFLYEHSAGSEYGPARCVSFFGEYSDMDATHSGDLFVFVDGNGDPIPENIRQAKRHLRLEGLAEAYFENKDPAYVPDLAILKFTGDLP